MPTVLHISNAKQGTPIGALSWNTFKVHGAISQLHTFKRRIVVMRGRRKSSHKDATGVYLRCRCRCVKWAERRPVLRGRLATDLLVSKGGPFDMAALVELGTVECCGQAPEIEDCYFDPRTAHYVVSSPIRFSGN